MFPFLLYIILLLLFALGKVAFLALVGTDWAVGDVLDIVWHGLAMDLSTAGYLMILPTLFYLVSIWWKRMALRRCLLPYYVIASLLVCMVWVVDTGLYPFWGFKLDATVFNYIDAPGDALASVSTGFVFGQVLLTLLLTVGMTWLLWRITPEKASTECRLPWQRAMQTALTSVLVCVLPILIRGGLSESTMNPGNAYYSQRQLLNHAAVNPLYSILYSIDLPDHFDEQYRLLPDDECRQTMSGLFDTEDDITDTLLTAERPDILLLIVEGMGDMFYPEGGCQPDVTPCLQRLSEESVWFSEYYNASFRTDRGVLSLLSGTVSFPSVSVMKMGTHSQRLPGMAHTLQQAGYTTEFWYGGDINFTNMRGYLTSTGYERTYGKDDFTAAEQKTGGKWGVCDSIVLDRVVTRMTERQQKPRFVTALTLSSHEPFEVPYHRLDDPVLNAFAYADHCIGKTIETLRRSSAWDHLLVIIVPDHGYRLNDLGKTDERFFRARMLWTGGAAVCPRRISTIMSQSDVAATLFSQLGLSHEDYRWSRNVLSREYAPFAYSSFVDGFLVRDTLGTSIYDNIGQTPLRDDPNDITPSRLQRGKAILQGSYDWLEQLGR